MRSTAIGVLAIAIMSVAIASVGIILNRIDRAKAIGVAARVELAGVRVELAGARAELAAVDVASLRADSERCRARTENLRRVLEVLIPSGVWPERVRLPDPPPGWNPWPEGNRYGLSTLPEDPEEP